MPKYKHELCTERKISLPISRYRRKRELYHTQLRISNPKFRGLEELWCSPFEPIQSDIWANPITSNMWINTKSFCRDGIGVLLRLVDCETWPLVPRITRQARTYHSLWKGCRGKRRIRGRLKLLNLIHTSKYAIISYRSWIELLPLIRHATKLATLRSHPSLVWLSKIICIGQTDETRIYLSYHIVPSSIVRSAR